MVFIISPPVISFHRFTCYPRLNQARFWIPPALPSIIIRLLSHSAVYPETKNS